MVPKKSNHDLVLYNNNKIAWNHLSFDSRDLITKSIHYISIKL